MNKIIFNLPLLKSEGCEQFEFQNLTVVQE
jgi:hypothetical protein